MPPYPQNDNCRRPEGRPAAAFNYRIVRKINILTTSAYGLVPLSEQSSDCDDEKIPKDSSRGEGRKTPSTRGSI